MATTCCSPWERVRSEASPPRSRRRWAREEKNDAGEIQLKPARTAAHEGADVASHQLARGRAGGPALYPRGSRRPRGVSRVVAGTGTAALGGIGEEPAGARRRRARDGHHDRWRAERFERLARWRGARGGRGSGGRGGAVLWRG